MGANITSTIIITANITFSIINIIMISITITEITYTFF